MFDFLKYISPLFYYRIAYKMPHAVILSEPALDDLLNQGKLNGGKFKQRQSFYIDLAYQALEAGYIPDESERTDLQNHVVRNVFDNYRFVHRFFGRKKAIYVLILRLISFHQPIREIWAFLMSKENRVQIQPVESTQFSNTSFDEKVSVIIPTLNRYEYLKDVLADLEKQSYKNFDVWVCDQSDNFDADFYKGWHLDLHLIKQEEKALWRARNSCVKQTTSQWVLFSEDDVRVKPDWIQSMIDTSEYYKSDVVCGVFSKSDILIGKLSRFKVSDFFASGNAFVNKRVFDKVGLFDEKFEKMRMGDGEFGLRCALNGILLVQNPKAICIDIKAPTGGLRQMGAWDAIHNIGLFKPRPIPSTLYLAKKHFDNKTAFIYGITQLPKAMVPYSLKNAGLLKQVPYLILALLLSPILLITFYISWSHSNKMLT